MQGTLVDQQGYTSWSEIVRSLTCFSMVRGVSSWTSLVGPVFWQQILRIAAG
jgi:hypothetical protein